jgi:hypothetical protein
VCWPTCRSPCWCGCDQTGFCAARPHPGEPGLLPCLPQWNHLGDEFGEYIHRQPVTRTVVPDDTFREQALAHGTPAPIADLMLSIFAAARNGEFTAVDPTLAKLIGREPATLVAQLEHAWAA